jgi:hypothetical protein
VKDGTEEAEKAWKDYLCENEPEIPGWIAVLNQRQKPLDVKHLSEEELTVQFEKRFVALLQRSGSTNSLEGWRDVAIDLALEFHPAFQLKVPKKLPVSGRPIDAFRWSIKNSFLSRKRRLEREAEQAAAGTRTEGKPIQKSAQAAREVAKEWGAAEAVARSATRHLSAKSSDGINKTPIAKTIQNFASERIPFPKEWSVYDHLLRVKLIAWNAARRITEV